MSMHIMGLVVAECVFFAAGNRGEFAWTVRSAKSLGFIRVTWACHFVKPCVEYDQTVPSDPAVTSLKIQPLVTQEELQSLIGKVDGRLVTQWFLYSKCKTRSTICRINMTISYGSNFPNSQACATNALASSDISSPGDSEISPWPCPSAREIALQWPGGLGELRPPSTLRPLLGNTSSRLGLWVPDKITTKHKSSVTIIIT